MEVEISSSVKIFKLYPVGRDAKSWGSIGAFRSLRSQSTAEIFLARELMGGIHNASLTRVHPYAGVSMNSMVFIESHNLIFVVDYTKCDI